MYRLIDHKQNILRPKGDQSFHTVWAQIGSVLKIPPDKVPVHYTEEYWKLIFHNAEITKQQRHPLRGISLSLLWFIWRTLNEPI